MHDNGKQHQQFEPEDMPAYCSSGLRSPHSYRDIKWTERYTPTYEVQVDPVQEGLTMADPVSRIVVAPRLVIPPDAFVHDVVEHQLYWHATSNKFVQRALG